MKVLATTTVIRGQGACDVFINNIVSEEIKKMNRDHDSKLKAITDELDSTKKKYIELHNEVLAYKLDIIRSYNAKPATAIARFCEAIDIAWCKFWGVGENIGMWVYERDDN